MKKQLLLKVLLAFSLTFFIASYALAREHAPPSWDKHITVQDYQAVNVNSATTGADYTVAEVYAQPVMNNEATAEEDTYRGVPAVYATELFLRRWPNSKAYLCSTSSHFIKNLAAPANNVLIPGKTSDLGSW